MSSTWRIPRAGFLIGLVAPAASPPVPSRLPASVTLTGDGWGHGRLPAVVDDGTGWQESEP
jgi:hypothetical protein